MGRRPLAFIHARERRVRADGRRGGITTPRLLARIARDVERFGDLRKTIPSDPWSILSALAGAEGSDDTERLAARWGSTVATLCDAVLVMRESLPLHDGPWDTAEFVRALRARSVGW